MLEGSDVARWAGDHKSQRPPRGLGGAGVPPDAASPCSVPIGPRAPRLRLPPQVPPQVSRDPGRSLIHSKPSAVTALRVRLLVVEHFLLKVAYFLNLDTR